MGFRISSVESGSLAQELGLEPGDEILSINGERLIDLIDYEQLLSDEQISLRVRDKASGEVFELECDKYPDEPLGVEFERDLMGPVRVCCNKCKFCFVEQLPKGMRDTLYVRDDDWRMSLMMGNYVTLTNVNDRELDRIIRRHASPLYISVHVSDGRARAELMGQPLAAKLMDQLRRLAQGGISFHAQCVLCPGVNDGALLDRTLRDLYALRPACLTVALVPVGLTGHREDLGEIVPYNAAGAGRVIDMTDAWQRRARGEGGDGFVYAADEFYVLAGRDVPPEGYYDDYPQIDNGVGMLRLQREGVRREYAAFLASGARPRARRVLIITGESAAAEIKSLVSEYRFTGVDVEVCAVRNDFFGGAVTVAGLLTGRDIIAQVKAQRPDEVLISSTMLRDGGDVLLDDTPVLALEKHFGCAVTPVFTDGESLVRALAGVDY